MKVRLILPKLSPLPAEILAVLPSVSEEVGIKAPPPQLLANVYPC